MGWLRDKLRDKYDSLKRKYDQAVNELIALRQKESSYREQKSQNDKKLAAYQTEKKSNKSRLDDIEEILKWMEGTGWFSLDVPDKISDANKSEDKLEKAMDNVFYADSASRLPNMDSTFDTQSIEQNYHSSEALRLFREEKRRLENKVDELEGLIRTAERTSTSLATKIIGNELEQVGQSAKIGSLSVELWILEKLL